jgi:hypothetical protein
MCVVNDITDRCAFDGFHIHIEKCEAQNQKEKKKKKKDLLLLLLLYK